jgi:hypothetical protein
VDTRGQYSFVKVESNEVFHQSVKIARGIM